MYYRIKWMNKKLIHVLYFIFMMWWHLMFRTIRKNYFSSGKKKLPVFYGEILEMLYGVGDYFIQFQLVTS